MTVRVHASTVAIDGRGVMIVGASGTGKSDLALRLIDRGALLVSDDYTECNVVRGIVTASPPPTIAGKIEVRGIGIVDIPYRPGVAVALVVILSDTVERMPETMRHDVAGVALPAARINALEASAPIKVELALAKLVGQA